MELSVAGRDFSGPEGSRPGRTVVRRAPEEARQQGCGRALVTWVGAGRAKEDGEMEGGWAGVQG